MPPPREESPLSDVDSDASTEPITEQPAQARQSSELSNTASSALSDVDSTTSSKRKRKRPTASRSSSTSSTDSATSDGPRTRKSPKLELAPGDPDPSDPAPPALITAPIDARDLPTPAEQETEARAAPLAAAEDAQPPTEPAPSKLVLEPEAPQEPTTQVTVDIEADIDQELDQEPEPEPEAEAEAEAEPEAEAEQEQEETAEEEHEELERATSSEPEDLADDAQRDRTRAIEALFKIEVEFAQLRDRLYIERMEDVAKEREQVEAGTHPELVFLNKAIERRRTTKLDLAAKWVTAMEHQYAIQQDANERMAWNDWTESKGTLRSTMLDQVNGKYRAAQREKRMSERLRDDRLADILAGHHDRRHYHQYLASLGRPYTEEELAWAFRRQAVPRESTDGLVGLERAVVTDDLFRMAQASPYPPTYSSAPVFPARPYGKSSADFGPAAAAPPLSYANGSASTAPITPVPIAGPSHTHNSSPSVLPSLSATMGPVDGPSVPSTTPIVFKPVPPQPSTITEQPSALPPPREEPPHASVPPLKPPEKALPPLTSSAPSAPLSSVSQAKEPLMPTSTAPKKHMPIQQPALSKRHEMDLDFPMGAPPPTSSMLVSEKVPYQ